DEEDPRPELLGKLVRRVQQLVRCHRLPVLLNDGAETTKNLRRPSRSPATTRLSGYSHEVARKVANQRRHLMNKAGHGHYARLSRWDWLMGGGIEYFKLQQLVTEM